MVKYFRESLDLARKAGVDRNKIIIDPGIGFGKTLAQNLEAVRRIRELDCLGLPVLLGTSRKSMIGKTLDLPPGQRVEGTAATVALGIANGVDIVRVHDVKEMVRVARMADAIVRVGPEEGPPIG
jgi:dihydropteroate synthase